VEFFNSHYDRGVRHVHANLKHLLKRRGKAEEDGGVLNYLDIPLTEDHVSM
jgi:hypothetical protein